MSSPERRESSRQHLFGYYPLRAAIGCCVALASAYVYFSGLEIATKIGVQQTWLQEALVPPAYYLVTNLVLEVIDRMAVSSARRRHSLF